MNKPTLGFLLFQSTTIYPVANIIYLCQCLFVESVQDISFKDHVQSLQWEASDAEIKVPSGEVTELKRSPFKA